MGYVRVSQSASIPLGSVRISPPLPVLIISSRWTHTARCLDPSPKVGCIEERGRTLETTEKSWTINCGSFFSASGPTFYGSPLEKGFLFFRLNHIGQKWLISIHLPKSGLTRLEFNLTHLSRHSLPGSANLVGLVNSDLGLLVSRAFGFRRADPPATVDQVSCSMDPVNGLVMPPPMWALHNDPRLQAAPDPTVRSKPDSNYCSSRVHAFPTSDSTNYDRRLSDPFKKCVKELPRASLRMLNCVKDNVLHRAMNQKARLREGASIELDKPARKISAKKIKMKSLQCDIKLSDEEAEDLQQFLPIGA